MVLPDVVIFAFAMVVAAVLTAVATPAFAQLARRRGIVVAPREDRWHRRPTPLLGGAAMALGLFLVLLSADAGNARVTAVAAAAFAAFALGLLDDLRRLAPTTKLVGQVIVASILVIGGVKVEIVEVAPIAFVLTVFWVVALMNAVNLMDNMDGLAAGITAIAAAGLGVSALGLDRSAVLVAGVTAGVSFGFLVHNFAPARSFMGDAGSQMLGLLLASAALLHTASAAVNLGIAVLGPLAVLALPIFDMTLVSAARRFAGRPISQGGRDHVSHRLAALGLSDRRAVLVLYGVALGLVGIGNLATAATTLLPTLLGTTLLALILFGLFLGEVDVYGRRNRSEATTSGQVRGRVIVYSRFGAEVALDVVALTVAYYTAYVMRYEGTPDSAWIDLFVRSLPLVVGAQLGALVLVGVYRSLWRYLGITDAIRIIGATALGSALAVLAVLLAFRFEGHSRAVFVLDWLFASVLIMGSRLFFLWLRHLFMPGPVPEARRVLIVGATDNGAIAARMLRSSGATYRPVGILDDDPGKRFRQVAGIPIVGATGDFERVAGRLDVDLVVLALEQRDAETTSRIRDLCEERGIEVRDFKVPV